MISNTYRGVEGSKGDLRAGLSRGVEDKQREGKERKGKERKGKERRKEGKKERKKERKRKKEEVVEDEKKILAKLGAFMKAQC